LISPNIEKITIITTFFSLGLLKNNFYTSHTEYSNFMRRVGKNLVKILKTMYRGEVEDWNKGEF
jgi:hypothetical protein